jgi:Domain of unknown function (DUF4190)
MTTPTAPQPDSQLPSLASLTQPAPASAPPVTPPQPQPTGELFTPLAQPAPGTAPYMPLSQPQQQPQPMYYAPAPMYAPAPPTNTMAILALVFSFLFWPLAIVFGHTARKQIARTGEGGGGMATAGLVIGYLGLAAAVLIVLILVVAAGAGVSSVPAG